MHSNSTGTRRRDGLAWKTVTGSAGAFRLPRFSAASDSSAMFRPKSSARPYWASASLSAGSMQVPGQGVVEVVE